jgi:hypothetical protein
MTWPMRIISALRVPSKAVACLAHAASRLGLRLQRIASWFGARSGLAPTITPKSSADPETLLQRRRRLQDRYARTRSYADLHKLRQATADCLRRGACSDATLRSPR